MKDLSKNLKKLTLLALILIIVGAIGAAVVGDGNSGSTVTLEEVVNATGVDHVRIRTRNQRVQIHRTTDSEARIVSSRVPSNATLIAEVVNNVLTIEMRIPRQMQFGINFGSIRYLTDPPGLDVYLPETMYEQVIINSTNGRIEVSDFEIADLQIETTHAAIELKNIIGNIDVSTSNGRINVSRITGEASRLRTTNGAIEISDVIGDIEAQTTNGRITFNNETIEQHVDLQSTNGGIEVNLRSEPEHAAFNLRTTNGRTEIFGNNNTSQQFGDGRYDVTLRTSNGRITVE